MYWDGERWLPENASVRRIRPRRQPRGWVASAAMTVGLVALVFPVVGAGAGGNSGKSGGSSPTQTPAVAVIQESSRDVRYRGDWQQTSDAGYLGGRARMAETADARATLRFTGSAVAWVGPVGPSHGRARVLIDGTAVATVSAWAAAPAPTRVLFTQTWSSVGTHRIAIVTTATPSRPSVTLDAFVVKLDTGGGFALVDDTGSPIATASPDTSTPAPPTANPSAPVASSAGPATPTASAPALSTPTPALATPTAAPSATVPSQPAPTPTPTAKPTSAPTAAPTPAPDPTLPPGTRPFAGPVTTATYKVPSSIDATGATDVSNSLNDWIDSLPNGSVVSFPASGTYLLSEGIKLGNRTNMVFDGNGATLRLSGSAGNYRASAFVLGWSHHLGYWTGGSAHIAIKDFRFIGNDPTPGTYGGGENQMGVAIIGSRYIEVSNVVVRAVHGDAFFVNGSKDVWLHANHVVTAGRNGLTVVEGARVLAESSDYDKVGYVTFDDEPNESSEASTDITFRNNTAGTWGLTFVSVEGGHRGAPIHRITVTGNVTTGKALACQIDNGGTARMTDIIFSDNRSAITASGPRLFFAHIDGLTVTGNIQPLSSGPLAKITDSTGVTYP